MTQFIDIAGKVFGRLTALSRAENARNGQTQWLCQCICGNTCVVRAPKLKSGHTKSCGCICKDGLGTLRHRMCKTDEYNAWQHIRSRCYNKNSPAYPEYGGRGITVCDRWLESFENFYADMGPKPSRKHSIDRYPDNDGPYSPSNCRWATRAEQNRNTRQNVILEFNGKRMCLTEWADLLGICKTTLFARIQRDGWSVERALTTPADPAAGRFLPEPVTHNGRTMSVKDWARETGICYGTIKSRLRKGWTVDEALSISPQRTGHRSKLKPGS